MVMLIEAVVVMVRQSNHFRVTRALRPLFLLDTYYCRGIRRLVLRVVLLTLPAFSQWLTILIIISTYILVNNVPFLTIDCCYKKVD